MNLSMPAPPELRAVTLRQVLAGVGEPVVDVVAAPAGLDIPVAGVAIVDPEDDLGHYPDQLVLVIGARGREAARLVRAVARHGAVAVAVKAAPDAVGELRTTGAPVAVLAVAPGARWEQLELRLRDVLDGAGPAQSRGDDLFALAQTIARLTGGIVSIEDTASRVLAYSRADSDADVDELRRLSILGWQGPPTYLRMLREWGVFDRLRAGEDVVRIEPRDDLGIRRRLAAGIHAGRRQLGTIWVQEGPGPFTEQAGSVLVGAARVAAGHLIRRRHRPAVDHDPVVDALEGHPPDPAAWSGEPAPVLVAAFAVRADGGDPAVADLARADLADVVPVHAAAFRRGARTAAVGARVYAVLPGVDRAEPAVVALCQEITGSVHRRTGARVQAGVGSAVPRLAEVTASRAEADRVLDAMDPGADVAAIGDLRAEVLLRQTLAMLAANPDLHDPAVERLVAYDARHGADLAGSVLAWLDAMGDVRSAAAVLGVHPNTLRYRVRRAEEIAGLTLADARARLIHHLQLLIAHRRPIRQTGVVNAVHPDKPSRSDDS